MNDVGEVLELEQRLVLLADVTRAFVEHGRDFDRLIGVVAKRIAEALGDSCSLFMLEPTTRELVPVALHDPDLVTMGFAREAMMEPILLDRQPVARGVIESGEPFLGVDLRADDLKPPLTTPRYYDLLVRMELRGMLMLPLRGRDRVIGMLILVRHGADRPRYSDRDTMLAGALADHAALMIQNARAYAAEQRALRDAEAARVALDAASREARAFFELTAVPMFAFDLETHSILEANHAAVELYGYSADEMRQLRIDDLRLPVKQAELAARLQAAGDAPFTSRGQHRRKDGTVLEVEGTSHVSSIGGRPARFVIIIDVTARTCAEHARRRAEARFDRLFDSGLLGVVLVDPRGHVREINETALELIGYSREELSSVVWSSMVAPEWSEQQRISIQNLRTFGIDRARHIEYMHADGRRVPVVTGAAVLPDEDLALRVIIDLEGQRWARGALEHLREVLASEAKFRAFVETAPDGTVIIDHEGKIALVNLRAEQLFGYPREELVGEPIEMLVPEHLREGHVHHVAGYVGDPYHRQLGVRQELRGRRKDGTEFPIEVSLNPLHTDQGLFVTASVRDVSDRRRIETALRDANDELEAFSYSVAHDLRAPLRAINGFSEMLLESQQTLDEDGRDWLQEIVENVARMRALIEALLGLARVARAPLHRTPTDLAAIAREIIAELARLEPERAHDVRIPDILMLDVDPTLVRVLLHNLLGNAWKFTARRSRAEIELGERLANGMRVLYVRDNGAGFEPARAQRLFTPFQRMHTASEFPGTGVGLSTVQRIVHRHGGRIWTEAAVDQGATIFFTLPTAPHTEEA
ncbi:MAG: PAS domain S-box protein [Kofleriaceae bacterium]